MNVDYLPSVVTVIDAKNYVDAGVQNIGKALNMLPGVQMQLSPMGYNITTVRGLKNPNAYLSDKIKILIDGVAINNEIQGSSSFYMDFPMMLVEKIEVLRGPGSTIYGAGSFYATINVITKLGNGVNEFFVGAGSYDNRMIGAIFSAKAGEWSLFADGYYDQNQKRLKMPVGFSRFGNESDEGKQDVTLGFKATNGKLEFLSRYKQNTYGNFYGFEEELDPIPNNDRQTHMNRYFFAQLAYKEDLNDYRLEVKGGFSHRDLDVSADIYAIDTIASRFATVGIDMQEGFAYQERSSEQNYEAELILSLPQVSSHDISLGAGAKRTVVLSDEFYSSIEEAIMQNMTAIQSHPNFNSFRYRPIKESAFWADPTRKLLQEDLSRDLLYGYVEDLISIDEDIDMVLGLRVDRYSDFGSQLSKRASLVYRASDEVVAKLLYGSAFRAPTLIEAYQNGHINFRAGDESIKPEETDTYELALIYSPDIANKLSLNFFYSQLRNVIDLEEQPDTNPGYQNFDDRISKGVEFEYTYRTKTAHEFYLNASYIDTVYTVPEEDGIAAFDESMPDISKYMFKAMHIFRPTSRLSFGTTWRYESATTQTYLPWIVDENADTRVDAMHIFDETLTYRWDSANTLRVVVKNLLNTQVRQPSYYYGHDKGILREGRDFFLNYAYSF